VARRRGPGRHDGLGDEALVALYRRARRRGDAEAARRALGLLAFRQWEALNRRLRAKLPAHAVEDVAGEVVLRAMTSSFDGTSAWHFRAWIATIARRTVADWYARRRRTVPQEPLGTRAGDLAASIGVTGEVEAAELRMLVDDVLDELDEVHRRVVELLVFADRPAGEAVHELRGMSEANAYQVVRRFRQRLRVLLEERQDA